MFLTPTLFLIGVGSDGDMQITEAFVLIVRSTLVHYKAVTVF